MAASRSFRWFWILTAMVVSLQLVAVQAMATSPALHEHCHAHSHERDHTCAVTLILSGGYECHVPDIVPVTIAVEPPELPVSTQTTAGIVPQRLPGVVVSDAPPRGP